jgi:hypothetical protein
MNSDEATGVVIDALDALEIPYMVVGSFSTNFYGIPRSTQDADIVVQLKPGAISMLADRLQPTFRLDPQMSFETITATKRYILHMADDIGAFTVELFLLSEDDHDQQRFAQRRSERIVEREVFIPSVEDVIITKLRWSHAGGRRKDIEDVENVIAVQGDRIDWPYVYSWCDRHGTRELLDQVRESLRKV